MYAHTTPVYVYLVFFSDVKIVQCVERKMTNDTTRKSESSPKYVPKCVRCIQTRRNHVILPKLRLICDHTHTANERAFLIREIKQKTKKKNKLKKSLSKSIERLITGQSG